MTRTTLRELRSCGEGVADTFADRLADAITRVLVEPPQAPRLERHAQTLEQLIARAIDKELPR